MQTDKFAYAAAIAVACGQANAQMPKNIQGHDIQNLFWAAPCTEVIATLDMNPPIDAGPQALIDLLATQGVAWGHLLGFESAHPGIRGDHETILKRLRLECATTPDRTAIEILKNLVSSQ